MSLRTLALSTALLLALTGLSVAQDRDRDDEGISAQPQYAGQQAYQNGFLDGSNDGTTDRQSGHVFRASGTERYEHGDNGYNSSFGEKDVYKRFYRQGYMDGYQRAFNGAMVAVQPSAPVVAVPVYTQPGYSFAQRVYQNGFQDGARDGAYDRDSGHSFRAMESESYKHADAGYSHEFGDKDQYKQAYREGYSAGYGQGFNGSAGARVYPNAAPATGVVVATPSGTAIAAPVAPASAGPAGVAVPVYGQPATQSPAYQAGFQDGVSDGSNDKREGRDFSPQKRDRYKHADNGYNSSFGDKSDYKQAYRDAYLAGYRRGYGK